MNRNFQDRIDDYIQGRMSTEDRALFEAELSQDEVKQKQFEFTKNLKRAITSREDKMAMMAKMRARYDAESTTAHTERESRTPAAASKVYISKRALIWISSIAAVLVVGLFIMPSFPLFDSNVGSVSPSSPVIRGDVDDVFDSDAEEFEEPVDSLKQDSVVIDNRIMNNE